MQQVRVGDVVRIAAGTATVHAVDARVGRARGIRVLRHRSGNYALDAEGRPFETPVQFTEFIQHGLWNLVPPAAAHEG